MLEKLTEAVSFCLENSAGNFAEFLFGFDDQFWHEFNLATDTSQIQDFENFFQKCVHNEAPQVPIIYWVRNHTLSGSLSVCTLKE